MKVLTKKIFCVCILMIFLLAFLQMFLLYLLFTKSKIQMNSMIAPLVLTYSLPNKNAVNCSLDFHNPFVLENLVPDIETVPFERLKSIVDLYKEQCWKKINSISVDDSTAAVIPKSFFVPAFENHFLVYSPRVAIEEMKNVPRRIPMCPAISPLLKGFINVSISNETELRHRNGSYYNWPMTFEEIAILYPYLILGGFYPGPRECKCRSLNAIIVPYRNREVHLRYFLYYIHQLLQRQQLCYVVFVAEQADQSIFNKGQIMNTAYRYAKETTKFDCYIFHDVDILAEDDRILYACRDDAVIHLAPHIDKFEYKTFRGLTVGAAVAFTPQQYELLNGYSNEYAGWGGEDNDMKKRIELKNFAIWRSTQNYTKFKMIPHGSDVGNKINNHRFVRLLLAEERFVVDGINNLGTELSETIFYKTHTRLKIKTYKTVMQTMLEKNSTTPIAVVKKRPRFFDLFERVGIGRITSCCKKSNLTLQNKEKI